jgi:peptidoglycan/xylan/chitin deacetylase (PgdA/CDA1 family)
MHRYFIRTPWFVKRLFSSYVWSMPADDHAVYLSFDDGPHPTITPWVLNELMDAGAQASFFCIGDNVQKYPGVYQQVISEGHAIGNHTFHHLNGWHTDDKAYLQDIKNAAQLMDTNLFRPPYGRIRSGQAKKIDEAMGVNKAKIIMWDVLSADFDQSFSPEQCFENIVQNVSAGSIIVFHDSEKAWKNLEWVLPRTLEFLKISGFKMKKISL